MSWVFEADATAPHSCGPACGALFADCRSSEPLRPVNVPPPSPELGWEAHAARRCTWFRARPSAHLQFHPLGCSPGRQTTTLRGVRSVTANPLPSTCSHGYTSPSRQRHRHQPALQATGPPPTCLHPCIPASLSPTLSHNRALALSKQRHRDHLPPHSLTLSLSHHKHKMSLTFFSHTQTFFSSFFS